MKPRDAIRQQVVMRLQVSRWCTDVHPVRSRRNVRKESLPFFQKPREQTVFERMVLALRNQIEHARLKHVRASVDVSAVSIFRLWFLEESQHAPIVIRFNDAI